MIEDLLQMRAHLDSMIETYKDLHPDEKQPEIGSTIAYDSHTIEDIHYDISGNDVDQEEYEKQTALKRIREGYYETTFREKQRKKATESRERSITLCVYGDS